MVSHEKLNFFIAVRCRPKNSATEGAEGAEGEALRSSHPAMRGKMGGGSMEKSAIDGWFMMENPSVNG